MGFDARRAALACVLALAFAASGRSREFREGRGAEETPAGAEAPDLSPAENEDARIPLLADLKRIDSAIAAHPDSLPSRFHRLRILHMLGVEEEARVRTGEEELRRISARRGQAGSDPQLQAYRGAFQVLRAKHAAWPPRKREHLKAGLAALDSAVTANPSGIEVRYLRLTSSYRLPFFMGRKAAVREDFSALARLLPGALGKYPDPWYLGLARFVLEKGDAAPAEREALSAVIREAAAAGPEARMEGGGT